jgi:hypothetical protein
MCFCLRETHLRGMMAGPLVVLPFLAVEGQRAETSYRKRQTPFSWNTFALNDDENVGVFVSP